MPEAILQQKIFPYDGAFDATKHPLLISPKDVVDSQNIVYTTYSTKKKRPGVTTAFPTKFPTNRHILSGIDFWRLGKQRIVFYDGKNIISYDTAQDRYDIISSTFTVPIDTVVHFTAFQGFLITTFEDGVTTPKGWTGSGAMFNLDPTLPASPFCRIWLNKIWVPDPTIPGRVLYSQTGSIQFTGGDSGALDLDVNDGDPDGITAIFPPFFDALYITKRLSIYRVKPVILGGGALIFSYSKISDGIGCISHAAVAAGPGNLFFPSDEGVHYFVSTDKISEIETDDFSLQIQPLWIKETNFKRSRFMQGVYDLELKSYLITCPSESSLFPNDVWGYSIAAKKWYRWRGYNHTSIFRYIDSKSKRLRTLVGSKEGNIGFIDSSSTLDYDKPIDINLQSGIICPSGSPDDRFAFCSMTPIFAPQLSGTFKITYKIDGKFIETLTFQMEASLASGKLGEDFALGINALGGMPQVVCDNRRIKGYGMMHEFFIEHDGVGDGDDGFELLGILLDVDRTTKATGRTAA
jgi:hypothetical protein